MIVCLLTVSPPHLEVLCKRSLSLFELESEVLYHLLSRMAELELYVGERGERGEVSHALALTHHPSPHPGVLACPSKGRSVWWGVFCQFGHTCGRPSRGHHMMTHEAHIAADLQPFSRCT